MKNLNLLLIGALGILLLGCGQNSAKNNEINNDNNKFLIESGRQESENNIGSIITEFSDEKTLITNNSVGYLKIGAAWQNSAKNDYNYNINQSYGSCIDGCCDGGFLLEKNDQDLSETAGDAIQLTIGAMDFDYNDSQDAHSGNSDVFYISSDNCKGWYWKDKINYIVIYSDLFKMKEDIGVGTTLEKVQEKFGKLIFDIGWIEEDVNALKIVLDPYPNISLILDINDFKDNWEIISAKGKENKLTISDFNKNTTIKRIIIQ